MINIKDYLNKDFDIDLKKNDFGTFASDESKIIAFLNPQTEVEVSRTEIAGLVDKLMEMPDGVEKDLTFCGLMDSDEELEVVAQRILSEL